MPSALHRRGGARARCASSTRSPTCASPASTRASTTWPTSSARPRCWPTRPAAPSAPDVDGAERRADRARPSARHVAQEQEAAVVARCGRAAGSAGFAGPAPSRPAWTCPPTSQRRQRQAELVEQAGADELVDEARTALAQRPSARRARSRAAPRSTDCSPARTTGMPSGTGPASSVVTTTPRPSVNRSAPKSRSRSSGSPRRCAGRAPTTAVALGPHGGRPHQHDRRQPRSSGEDLAVGLVAQAAGARRRSPSRRRPTPPCWRRRTDGPGGGARDRRRARPGRRSARAAVAAAPSLHAGTAAGGWTAPARRGHDGDAETRGTSPVTEPALSDAAPQTTDPTAPRTVFRTCPLCEATCGLEITVQRRPRSCRIRGDRDDVFTHGFICPKGSTLKQLHEDPDRLRTPLVKRDGAHVEVDVGRGVRRGRAPARAGHRAPRPRRRRRLPRQPDAPTTCRRQLFLRALLKALGTTQPATQRVDRRPDAQARVVGLHVRRRRCAIPVPDLDRTDYLLMLGANPFESNGSLCTAPDFPGRLEAIRARGGKVVVVDPRRSRTAEAADEQLAIRPGTDALLLVAHGRTRCSPTTSSTSATIAGRHLAGLDEVRDAGRAVHARGGGAGTRHRRGHDPPASPASWPRRRRAAVYGRIGTHTRRFGTVGVVAGRRAQHRSPATSTGPAARCSPARRPAAPTTRGTPGSGRGFRSAAGAAGCAGSRGAAASYPVAALAEEIDDAGRRARSGPWSRWPATRCCRPRTPTGSTPRSTSSTSWCRVDIYLNETTRHADVILPPPSAAAAHATTTSRCCSSRCATSPTTRPAVLPLDDGQPDEWEILARLALIAAGPGRRRRPGDRRRR